MTTATIAIVSITNLPAARFADGEPVEMLGITYKRNGELFAAVPMIVREDEEGKVRTDDEIVAAVRTAFPTAEDVPAPMFMQLMTDFSVIPADVLTEEGVAVRELAELGSFELDGDDSEAGPEYVGE